MLTELAVENLGVIQKLSLSFSPGMTALTGETGAGKTLLVTAVNLLLGGQAEPSLVRQGATEAVVEGRFVRSPESGQDGSQENGREGHEVVLRRVVPAEGRSRAYVDGRMASAATLAELGAQLVDLHGQHDHQSLLRKPTQRAALDQFGRVDTTLLDEARAALRELERQRHELGGDPTARAREAELCRFQLAELDEAQLTDPDEDDQLRAEQELLAHAEAHRQAAETAARAMGADGPVGSGLAEAVAALQDRPPFLAQHEELVRLANEATEAAAELRRAADAVEEDPTRLAEIGERRELLAQLCRKYGDTLAEVIAQREQIAQRLATLEEADSLAAGMDAEHARRAQALADAEAQVGAARRAVCDPLATTITDHLAGLALPRAQVRVQVGDDPGEDVQILLAANSGAPGLPLATAASGGELARVMLALRLVLTAGPPVLIFDEVDAGIGGAVAQTVGRALAQLTGDHQVLVVTHLPQVAACADQQVLVAKHDDGTSAWVTAEQLDHDGRVVELSRMLSGSPASSSARQHAEELLNSIRHTSTSGG